MSTLEKLWLLLSQCVNVLLGGDPDESLSARAWRQKRDKWISRIDAVLGKGHCRAVMIEQMRRQHGRIYHE